MTNICMNCGVQLSLMQRLLGQPHCGKCRSRVQREQEEAEKKERLEREAAFRELEEISNWVKALDEWLELPEPSSAQRDPSLLQRMALIPDQAAEMTTRLQALMDRPEAQSALLTTTRQQFFRQWAL